MFTHFLFFGFDDDDFWLFAMFLLLDDHVNLVNVGWSGVVLGGVVNFWNWSNKSTNKEILLG